MPLDGRCFLDAKLEGRYRILELYGDETTLNPSVHCLLINSVEEEGTGGLYYCRMERLSDEVMTEVERAAADILATEARSLCR